MKSLSFKLGVILIGLAIFGYAEVWGADWKLCGRNKLGIFYYDAESITRPSKGIVMVRLKSEYTDQSVIDMVKKYGKKYENLRYEIALVEINCPNKKIRGLSLTNYSKEGKIMFSRDKGGEWQNIAPESVLDSLCKAVCK